MPPYMEEKPTARPFGSSVSYCTRLGADLGGHQTWWLRVSLTSESIISFLFLLFSKTSWKVPLVL